MIQCRPVDFAGVYSGKAVTGTKIRVEFQRMLSDCEAGKIDMIITDPSVVKNTVTLLETVRRLKLMLTFILKNRIFIYQWGW